MAELTKADVKEVVDGAIHGAVGEIKELVVLKVDELAVMIKDGFDDVDRRFEQVDAKFLTVDRSLDRLQGDVTELKVDMKSVKQVVRSHSADIAELRATSSH